MFPLHHILQRPPMRPDGQAVYELRLADVVRKTEPALIAQFVCDRVLFGHVYRQLMSDHFTNMTTDSGVFIFPLVITQAIIPGATRPGDIDILVMPYHRDELILDQILAIEVKVIRASFLKQGKSPNEYGFSQASSLLELGFPYAAVVHLITSDKSPRQAWEETYFTTVLDNSGRVAAPQKIRTDLLSSNLVQRAYGRLLKNSTHPEIGFAAAYLYDALEKNDTRILCMPFGQDALRNPQRKSQTMRAAAEYFHRHALQAFDNPRGNELLLF
jgi:hypothetical protein